MHNSNFARWLGQILLGLGLVFISVEVARIFWASGWEVALGCAMVASLGLYIAVRAEAKERPQRLLRKAKRTLNLPQQWSIRFDKNVPHVGVIPVAVIRPDGVRFVIDIQGHTDAEGPDDTDDESQSHLVGRNGRKFRTDPVARLIQAGTDLGATAVLWLPKAKTSRQLRQKGSNLIVVMGNARDLKQALQST